MTRYLIALLILPLAGCGEDPIAPAIHVSCNEFLLEFEVAAGDTIETIDGLQYIDIQPGTGELASAGMITDVNYSGYLLNGMRFDTSCPANRTVYRLRIGAGQVIPGFELGILGMRAGGVRRLIIPPNLGYGNVPIDPIPANSTLVFDVELIGFPGR